MDAVLRVAAIASVEIAGKLQAPVPAARGLQKVAADRSHRAKLRRCREAAGFTQRSRDLRIDLQFGKRGPRTDPIALDAARDDVADLDERVGAHDSLAYEWNEIRSSRKRLRAVAERGDSCIG